MSIFTPKYFSDYCDSISGRLISKKKNLSSYLFLLGTRTTSIFWSTNCKPLERSHLLIMSIALLHLRIMISVYFTTTIRAVFPANPTILLGKLYVYLAFITRRILLNFKCRAVFENTFRDIICINFTVLSLVLKLV